MISSLNSSPTTPVLLHMNTQGTDGLLNTVFNWPNWFLKIPAWNVLLFYYSPYILLPLLQLDSTFFYHTMHMSAYTLHTHPSSQLESPLIILSCLCNFQETFFIISRSQPPSELLLKYWSCTTMTAFHPFLYIVSTSRLALSTSRPPKFVWSRRRDKL